MTTIAIVGAGPGLGAAVARRFGAEGFSIGLLSRTQERADGLAAQLVSEGLQAQGFAADVRDPARLARMLKRVTPTSIEEGHPEKDPAKLAEVIWDLHNARQTFRMEVATG